MLRIPHLFVDSTHRDHVIDLHLLNLPSPDHVPSVVNMVRIQELREGDSSSDSTYKAMSSSGSGSSTGSTYTNTTELEQLEQDVIPPYPPGFPSFQAFPPNHGGMICAVSVDELAVNGETYEQRQ
jgi:hypothetical protein